MAARPKSQRPHVPRDPNYIPLLGDRLAKGRPIAGRPPPPPPDAEQLAAQHRAITVHYIEQLGIDPSDPPVQAKVDLIDQTFRQIVGL